jgi:hypothetical protein
MVKVLRVWLVLLCRLGSGGVTLHDGASGVVYVRAASYRWHLLTL